MKYIIIPGSVAKPKKISILYYYNNYAAIRDEKIALIYFFDRSIYILTDLLSSLWVWIMIFMNHVSILRC